MVRLVLPMLFVMFAAPARAQQRESAERYRQMGDAYVAAGDRGTAIGWYRDAIAADPSDPRAYDSLARVYLSREQPSEARAVYEAGLQRVRQGDALYEGLALTLERLSLLDAATEVLRRWTELVPGSVEAHRGRARLAERRGRFAEALNAWRRVLFLSRDDVEAGPRVRALPRLVGTLDPAARTSWSP
jgi:tetratricopeptide (TPR) repeat protein